MTRPVRWRSPYVEPRPAHRIRRVLLSQDWTTWALRRMAESDSWAQAVRPCGSIDERELFEGYGADFEKT